MPANGRVATGVLGGMIALTAILLRERPAPRVDAGIALGWGSGFIGGITSSAGLTVSFSIANTPQREPGNVQIHPTTVEGEDDGSEYGHIISNQGERHPYAGVSGPSLSGPTTSSEVSDFWLERPCPESACLDLPHSVFSAIM